MPLSLYVLHLEGDFGDRRRAEVETRARLDSGDLLPEGRRIIEKRVADYTPIPWLRPSSGGITLIDFVYDTIHQHSSHEKVYWVIYRDVRVRDAGKKLDLESATKKLNAEGVHPRRGGVSWQTYANQIYNLTGHRYSLDYLRKYVREFRKNRP